MGNYIKGAEQNLIGDKRREMAEGFINLLARPREKEETGRRNIKTAQHTG
jgi:hypothetical protein